jgi:hypothetical protein
MILAGVLFVMALSGVALFVGINRWTLDGQDRALVDGERVALRTLQSCVLRVDRVILDAATQIEQQDALLTKIANVAALLDADNAAIVAANASAVIAAYDATNATIQAMRASCAAQVAVLEALLGQLLQGYNATPVTQAVGTCQFGTTGVQTIYTYQKLTINDVDFFYYLFDPTDAPSAVDPATGALQISGCSPALILRGESVVGLQFAAQIGAKLVGSPVAATDYLSGMQLGGETVTFYPASGVVDWTNQTFVIQEQLSLWAGLN